jgi:hypothetical protein
VTQAKLYKSIEDVRSIVDLKMPESLSLEYKGSKVIENANAICKAVTAFANSVGGQFVVGIEQATKHKPAALDGGVSGPSRLDWLYQIISANTFPSVETIEVDELEEASGRYYIVTVGASLKAPHQCGDHKYYKRRGSHSEPMEHYEIEDVRSRPKGDLAPLSVSLVKDEGLVLLRFFNTREAEDVTNIHCNIASNVKFQTDGIDTLANEGVKRLPPREELIFLLDSIGMMLQAREDAQFSVSVEYDYRGQRKRHSQTFYMADFKRSIIFREPIPKALYKMEERLESLSEGVRDLAREARKLETIADGSGLRLSQRTITAFKGRDQLFDPTEFDVLGYKIILDVTDAEAFSLNVSAGSVPHVADWDDRP